MNYYEHHIGDYAAATAHLSWDEDMAYTRLLRAYYHAERGILDGQQYRIARAATPSQRKAVDSVLNEFFRLVDGTHSQKRADEEIERYQDKQRKAKASADARWAQSERSPSAMRTHSERSANAERPQCEGNAPSLQTPDTRHQEGIPARKRATPPRSLKTPISPDFRVSDKVKSWAAEKGFDRLDEHLQAFVRKCSAKAYAYADWDAAFMEAVREDWAKLRGTTRNGAAPPPETTVNTEADRTAAMLAADAERAKRLRSPEEVAAIAKARERIARTA